MARQRWIQDPKTGQLIPAEEWHETLGADNAPFVFGDLKPYRSVVTGEEIGGRAQHRAHLRAHGLIEVGNERVKTPQPLGDTPGLKQEIARHLYR